MSVSGPRRVGDGQHERSNVVPTRHRPYFSYSFRLATPFAPKALHQPRDVRSSNPVGVESLVSAFPRVRSLRSRPWALGCNAVGVKASVLSISLEGRCQARFPWFSWFSWKPPGFHGILQLSM